MKSKLLKTVVFAKKFAKHSIKRRKNRVKTMRRIATGLAFVGDAVKLTVFVGIPLYLIAPGKPSKRQKAIFGNRSYAHRGLHTEDKSVPENSKKAFALAAEAGYGIELDVRLTKDKQVVVFHDDTLDRVCGVKGRVDKFSFDELQSFSLCETEEKIPLFSEVLELVGGRCPIIVELKNGKHNKELCKKTYDLLCAYSGPVCIESFDPTIVAWFKKNAPDMLRGQLATRMRGYKHNAKLPVAFLLSRGLTNFLARPQFIAYETGHRPLTIKLAELFGAMDVAWTVRKPKQAKHHDSIIFEHYSPKQYLK